MSRKLVVVMKSIQTQNLFTIMCLKLVVVMKSKCFQTQKMSRKLVVVMKLNHKMSLKLVVVIKWKSFQTQNHLKMWFI